MPKVSLYIPTYKQVDFLRLTLQSIVSQNYKDYEVIITDDSPDDSVAKLLTEFTFPGELIYIKNKVALGSPKNWNSALEKTTGELIKILHHDDRFIDQDALGKFVKFMDDYPEADFGFCQSMVVDQRSNQSRIHSPSIAQLQMLSSQPELLFLGNVIGGPSATIVRSNLKNIHYDANLRWLVDIDFYIAALKQAKDFIYIDQVLMLTPTNVAHQVTEACKNNSELEFYEHLYLYTKYKNDLLNHSLVFKHWVMLCGKYGVYNINSIPLREVLSEDQRRFFNHVFSYINNKPWLKFVFFLFWRLPLPPRIKRGFQSFINNIYLSFSGLRKFVRSYYL